MRKRKGEGLMEGMKEVKGRGWKERIEGEEKVNEEKF